MPIGVFIGVASAIFTAVVTEVYCHRYLAHNAFRLRRVPAGLLDIYFRVIVGTDPHSWAGVHRLHHRHADTPLDPHSPVQRSPLTILVGTPYLFAIAKRRLPANQPATLSIWLLRALVVAFYSVTCGPPQVLIMLSVHLVCYTGLGGLINTVGHIHGSKPHPEVVGYDLAWVAIPLLGHGYHNSHHAHPSAPRTGRLDPIWPLLRLGACLGAVNLDSRSSKPERQLTCCKAASTRPSAPLRSIGLASSAETAEGRLEALEAPLHGRSRAYPGRARNPDEYHPVGDRPHGDEVVRYEIRRTTGSARENLQALPRQADDAVPSSRSTKGNNNGCRHSPSCTAAAQAGLPRGPLLGVGDTREVRHRW